MFFADGTEKNILVPWKFIEGCKYIKFEDCNLYLSRENGDFTRLHYNTSTECKEALIRLHRESESLAYLGNKNVEILDKLKQKVEAIWVAPGMPGMLEAKESFQRLL